jgi:succinate dehydrogenase / fumarate reductase flavoprotein subunit
MTHQCSVFRDKPTLEQALNRIRELKGRAANMGLTCSGKRFNYELEEAFELQNMLKLAEAMVLSALKREESRGAHYRNDFPSRNDVAWLRHSLVFNSPMGLEVRYKPVTITRFEPKERVY